MWVSIGQTPENLAPSSRTKHSATLLGNDVYVFGGRNGNLPLKDLWKYNISEYRTHIYKFQYGVCEIDTIQIKINN